MIVEEAFLRLDNYIQLTSLKQAITHYKNFFTVPNWDAQLMSSTLHNWNSTAGGNITVLYEEFKNFAKHINSDIKIEMFAHGNILAENLTEIHQLITNLKLNNNIIRPTQIIQKRNTVMNPGDSYGFRTETTGADKINAGIVTFFQFSKESYKLSLLLSSLQMIISEAFYNEIRVKHQLGYIANTQAVNSRGILGMAFFVQSRTPPHELDNYIENFIVHLFKEQVLTMKDSIWENTVSSVKDNLLEEPKTLDEISSQYFAEIIDKTYIFDRKNQSAAVDITKQDLICFCNQYLWNNATRRRFTFQIYTNDDFHDFPEWITQIDKVDDFVRFRDLSSPANEESLLSEEVEWSAESCDSLAKDASSSSSSSYVIPFLIVMISFMILLVLGYLAYRSFWKKRVVGRTDSSSQPWLSLPETVGDEDKGL